MTEISPFSLLNHYKIKTINNQLMEPDELTPREIVLLNILKSCGTAASFQLETLWNNKEGRRKLKKMARQKLIARYKLEGERKLNIYSLDPELELEEALRQMAFTQLYMKMRAQMPCSATLGPAPFTGLINMNKIFPVLVIRKGDAISTLKINAPRLIVVSEEYVKLNPGIEYRIATDKDLLEKPLHLAFRTPDGDRDEVRLFATG